MHKNKDNHTNLYKRIIVQLLPLSISLFANCNTKLDLTSTPVDSQPAQPSISIGYQSYTNALTDEEENQETYFDQNQEGFAKLPIELQAYILSFLDEKDFHRASLVCQDWRDAAFIAGEEKILNLSYKKLNQKDCYVLLKVPFCSIIIKECQLGDQEVLILSQSTRIKHLDLCRNSIGDEGAKALAGGNLSVLPSLYLMLNELWNIRYKALEAGGLYALVSPLKKGNLVALTSLNLGSNKIGDSGAKDLASGNLSSLTYLNLSSNKIGDSGAKDLASGNLSSLTSLNLSSNKIGDSGAKDLASGNLSNLAYMYLYNNSIGDAGAQALASGNLPNLASLDLSSNKIGAAGVQALASGNLPNLTSLDLYRNSIGDAGAQALASGNLPNLTSLDLGSNSIGYKGKKALKAWATKKFIKLNL